ncbi:hypothetical protein [Lacticaseibacillus salsurivasis]|uniref:hypothetical protein n=1 Tax=Lacticaseibacillus salsurivasis TaxID=3081441 RepID=UPI0030C6C43C
MAEQVTLTQITQGMADGGTAIGANFEVIAPLLNQLLAAGNVTSYTVTQSDIIDTAGITSADGTLFRVGNIVLFGFHGAAGAPKSGTDTQDVFNIPVGYQPASMHGQLPLSWVQSATVTSQRAGISGSAYTVKWRMAAGNAYIAGAWLTQDDQPTE